MRKYLIIGSLSLLFTIGCASTATYFITPDFTGERLILGGIAVFPVLAQETGKYEFAIESYCRSAGEKLASRLRRIQPDLRVVGPTGVGYIFDKEDLVNDYSRLIEHYQAAGVLNADISKKLSEPLGVRYFMLGRIHDLYSVGNDANASLSIQIWDAHEAEMVFESNAEYKAAGLRTPPYDRATAKAVSEIVGRISMAL